jgi:hypothetical protein
MELPELPELPKNPQRRSPFPTWIFRSFGYFDLL